MCRWVGTGREVGGSAFVARAAKNKCAARAVNFRLPCVCHARAVSCIFGASRGGA